MDALERFADRAMDRAPAGLEQRAVRDLLHEPVAEAVLGRGSASLLDHELKPLELGQGREQANLREDALEQREPEGAADDRGRRDQLASLVVEPAEPSLQRLLDGGRDRGLAGEDEPAVLANERAPLAEVADGLTQ